MALDGVVSGQVYGTEFGSAYFSVWLGPNPVSKTLQEGMFDLATKDRSHKHATIFPGNKQGPHPCHFSLSVVLQILTKASS